nr:hypothetical protein [Tanacetum cinerariifolium]
MKDNLTIVVTKGIKLGWEKTKDDIASMVAEAVRKEQERTRDELALLVSNDVATNVPPVDDFHSHNHEDHHHDDARTKGESSAKRRTPFEESNQEQQEEFDVWDDDQGTNDDEVPSEEVSPKLIAKISRKGMKSGPSIDDLKQMKYALNNMMRSRCNSGEEHQDHLDQMKSYMESHICGKQRKKFFIFETSKETSSSIP